MAALERGGRRGMDFNAPAANAKLQLLHGGTADMSDANRRGFREQLKRSAGKELIYERRVKRDSGFVCRMISGSHLQRSPQDHIR